MMRRWKLILLSLMVAGAMVACGTPDEDPNNDSNDNNGVADAGDAADDEDADGEECEPETPICCDLTTGETEEPECDDGTWVCPAPTTEISPDEICEPEGDAGDTGDNGDTGDAENGDDTG